MSENITNPEATELTGPWVSSAKRVFGLDFVRAFSILLVLLQHAHVNVPGLAPLKIGAIGVEIFFVLSGFLVGGIALRALTRDCTFTSVFRFWVRRWYRILPLYYLMIAVNFYLVSPTIGHNVIWYLLFLQNNIYGIGFYPVTWSLVIEEWFYLAMPIVVLIALKVHRSSAAIYVALIGVILGVNVLRLLYVLNGDVPFNGVNGNPPFRFDSLFLGVLLAHIKIASPALYRVLETNRVCALGGTLMLGYLAIYWMWANPINRIDELLFPRTIGFFVLASCIALCLPRFDRWKRVTTSSKVVKWFSCGVLNTSLLTYAIYLVHPLVYARVFQSPVYTLGWMSEFLIALLITFAISWILYRWYEKPFLKLRDRRAPDVSSRI